MDTRIDYLSNPLALKLVEHTNSAWAILHDSALPATTQELVKIRASQINGCGFCTDMHIKEALHAGENQPRLNLVAVWREARVFTEAERAALELARTPDLLHAISRQHVHPRPSPQVTVPAGAPRSAGVRVRCGTFVLYSPGPLPLS